MTEDLEPGFEFLPQPPAPRRRNAKLIAPVAAVIVLAGGGVATYAAFGSGGGAGSSSATAAVQKVVGDLQHSDLIGLINDLAPNERDAIRPALTSSIASLKRLDVLSSTANASSVPGLTFTAKALVYGKTVTINDAVQIVPITAGTFAMSAEVAKLPVTRRLLDLAKTTSGNSSQTQTIGSQPVRIAAQRSGGRWYASLFYTVADQAAGHRVPTKSDYVAAVGASSPKAAYQTILQDLLSGNPSSALALISPSELPAAHDYGGLIPSTHSTRLPVSITSLDLTTTDVTGGVRVNVHKLTATALGHKITVTIGGGCVQVAGLPTAALGGTGRLCGADLAKLASTFDEVCSGSVSFENGPGGTPRRYSNYSADGPVCKGPTFTTAQTTALAHVFTGLTTVGVVTTETSGEWYVAPVRTLASNLATLLGALQGDDVFSLATIGR